MNTLYDVLEVSEKASKEVIEKAYRVLAKRYHPDLQTVDNKKIAEEKMKQINEAYDILSDDIKRKAYDEELEIKREEKRKNSSTQQINQTPYKQNMEQGQYENQNSNSYNKVTDMQNRRYQERMRKEEEKMRIQMQENLQKEYENAYYNYLRSLGYKIKEKWTWEKTKRLLMILLGLGIIITILWFLPPTHNMIMNFYENNKIVKIIVDIIGGIIIAIFKTIGSMFMNIFGSK